MAKRKYGNGRWQLFLCALFGHNWGSDGAAWEVMTGLALGRENVGFCKRCGLYITKKAAVIRNELDAYEEQQKKIGFQLPLKGKKDEE